MEETKNKEYVNYKVIRDAFRYLEININEAEMEYILMHLFNYTYNLESLPYQKIFALAENITTSPLLTVKSPSKRSSSFQANTVFGLQKILKRASVAISVTKRASTFSLMSDQIEELNKNTEFPLKNINDNEIEIKSFFFFLISF